MNDTVPTKERKKQLTADLIIIGIATFLVTGLVVGVFGGAINSLIKDNSVPIVLRVIPVALCQYGLAGLGITIVCILRKESFTRFGLNTKHLLPALLLSLACCVPDLIYQLYRGNVHPWCPFIDVNTTREVLSSGFPSNVIGMLITALCWGFFEGFNYAVIQDKLSELLPSKLRWWDWGAFICAVMCILIHGAVGVTPDALIEMLVTIILIYGMLIVKKETRNAWGCVLVFFVYWNAM